MVIFCKTAEFRGSRQAFKCLNSVERDAIKENNTFYRGYHYLMHWSLSLADIFACAINLSPVE